MNGRLGNFFNSEDFGRSTDLPWKLFCNSHQAYNYLVMI
ncbi:MAG: prolipoprotein diacylglyceryl transferase family protein [Xenococcus sp. (in: cyanobacteria)]